MDSFEWNKVFGAVLAGALLIMGIKTLVGGGHGGHHVDLAYTIEVPESGAAEAVVEEGPSLAALLAGADIGRGEREFAKCRACHTVDKGGDNRLGPNLYGVMGRAVASKDGFGYSGALTEHGGDWSWDRMDAWIRSPKAAVPGNAMSFNGISKDQNRANLLAYLNSLSDSPLDLPVEEVVEAVEDAVDAVEAVAEEAAEAGAH